jgi:hypothetical protein
VHIVLRITLSSRRTTLACHVRVIHFTPHHARVTHNHAASRTSRLVSRWCILHARLTPHHAASITLHITLSSRRITLHITFTSRLQHAASRCITLYHAASRCITHAQK